MGSPRIVGPRGFTLVELLVVIVIIALISAVALPVVLPALNERRVSEAARVFQSVLVGARDAAIRANAPRGIRLLPDPILSPPPYGNQGFDVLASNRFVAIEPAPDYHEGSIVAVAPSPITNAIPGSFLHVKQANFSSLGGVSLPTEPTGWSYNIRQGDKIRFNDSGAYYTVAGPMQKGPLFKSGTVTVNHNTERYVNDERDPAALAKAAGIALGLLDQQFGYPIGVIVDTMGNQAIDTRYGSDYLNLVNGVDDDGDGWVDEGFDGIDNDGDGVTDPGYNGIDDNNNGVVDETLELFVGNEFEQEVFVGAAPNQLPAPTYPLGSNLLTPSPYTIVRRPIVSPGARETTLPEGAVIDMTTWNSASATPAAFVFPNPPDPSFPNGRPIQFPERSRVPVDPYTYFVDVMVSPGGQVIQAGAGSAGNSNSNSSPTSNLPFYHFWLTDRAAVVPPLWSPAQAGGVGGGSAYIANRNPNYPAQTYQLPMPEGTQGYATMPDDPNKPRPNYSTRPAYLTGERRLVTLFTRTGQVVTNSIEIAPVDPVTKLPTSSGFHAVDINNPYYDAQAGIKEQQ